MAFIADSPYKIMTTGPDSDRSVVIRRDNYDGTEACVDLSPVFSLSYTRAEELADFLENFCAREPRRIISASSLLKQAITMKEKEIALNVGKNLSLFNDIQCLKAEIKEAESLEAREKGRPS